MTARTRRVGERGPVVRAVLLFFVLFATFQAVFVSLLAESEAFRGYLSASATVSAQLLRWLGYDVDATGAAIHGTPGALSVARGCDGIQPIVLLVLAVMLFSAPRWWKLAGTVAGAGVLLALNLARIVSLYVVMVEAPSAFQLSHKVLWPAVFILATLLLWWSWARLVVQRDTRVR